jgi:peptidoglycan hydrolase CwlO-like protein
LIIDVEADNAAKTSSSKTASSDASPEPSGGLDEATAQAAGLSAAPSAKSEIKAKSEAPAEERPTPPSDDAPVVPPIAQSGGSEPSPFYLFAAGLIGALLALVLMFLASVMGLFSLSDGRVDEQAAALAALETRVGAVEAQGTAPEEGAQAFDPAVLEPLESDISALRTDLDSVLQTPVGDGDAPALADLDATLAEALAPLDGRLSAVEDQLQSAIAALSAAEDSGAPAVVTADPALAASVDTLSSALDAVRGDLEGAQSQLAEIASQQNAVPPEAVARLDALDGLVAESGAQISALGEEIAVLSASIESVRDTVDVRLGAMASDLTAMAEAPVAQAPDRLARLGVALDALVAARDGGQDVSDALTATQVAASFDDVLSDTLAPVSGGQVAGALDGASLLATYDSAYDAMRAAAPASEGGGLLGALEDRARQMVTIRAPEGSAVLSSGNDPLDQLDALGRLIVEARFEDAVTLATRLPAGVQQASDGLVEALHARVALDEAIANSRHALVRALQEPDAAGSGDDASVTDAIPTDSSSTNSQ